MPGQPQIFDQSNFGEALWGGLAGPVSNPPSTSFAIPNIIATPADNIPFAFTVPSLIDLTITIDFTRLLEPTETISGFVITPSSSLLTVINSTNGTNTVSTYINNSLQNGQTASVLFAFTGTLGTEQSRTVTLTSYDTGATITL